MVRMFGSRTGVARLFRSSRASVKNRFGLTTGAYGSESSSPGEEQPRGEAAPRLTGDRCIERGLMTARDLYLILIILSALLTGGACRLIAELVHHGTWKPSRNLFGFFGTRFIFDLWNGAAQSLTGFHPNAYVVCPAFAGWVVAVASTMTVGRGITLKEFLEGPTGGESKFISLGLSQPNDPAR